MADEKVSIIVDLQDKASAGLKDIKASMTDWDSAVASSQRFAAGLAVVGAAITGIAAYSIGQAQEAVAGQKELEAVLLSTGGAAGMTADAINGLASELSLVTNFSDDAILAGQNMLLTFTNIGSDVFPQATEATLNLAQKFGSVESASVQLGKALNDPIAGVTALRKVGVALTEAQEESIKKFMEVGDIASAQKIILGELETEFGGLAKAVADPMTIAKNQFGEVAETLGLVLLPYVNEAATAFLEWMDSMGGAQGIVDKLQAAFEAIEPYFPIIATAILFGLVPAVKAFAIAAWQANAPLLPWIAAGIAVGAMIMGIIYVINNWGAIVDWIKGKLEYAWLFIQVLTESVFGWISTFLSDTWNNIKLVVGTLVDATWAVITAPFYVGVALIKAILDLFGIDWETAWTWVKDTAGEIWDAIAATFDTAMNALKAVWDTIWNAIVWTATTVWAGILSIINNGWAAIKFLFDLGYDVFVAPWVVVWDAIAAVVTSVWDNIKGTVADSINWIINKINGLIAAANAVSGAVKGPTLPSIPPVAFSRGGIVDWSQQGTDTVPAMLTPGERVLTPMQNREYESGMGAKIEIHIHDTNVFDTDDVITKIGDPIIQVLKQHFSV